MFNGCGHGERSWPDATALPFSSGNSGNCYGPPVSASMSRLAETAITQRTVLVPLRSDGHERQTRGCHENADHQSAAIFRNSVGN
jgi:hypothetical protein